MRIEELILEGFKSYPVRTTITGWDPSFNAITGLNGSGKSNILDAICFVLGITNMTQVRANNLMDLIYKRGQAGVTKASVTIVFNNQDRSTSPVGFENTAQITVTRQIAVGNTSKYLLNGHKSTLQALQNLFQSVQLNINNPNFLIMQGKITKVLNMKPQEILGMVEEASGTRMFEDRKEKAWKTMARKEKKVEELASLLREEIEPKLDKLREEKRSYLAYQKATSELERLTRLVKAYEWTLAVKRAAAAASEIEERHAQIKAAQADARAYVDEQGRMEKEIGEIQRRRDKELAKGGKFQALADTVATLERELVKVQTQLEIKTGTVADEAKRLQTAKKAVEDLRASTEAKRTSTATESAAFAKFKASYDESAADVAKTEELLQTLLTGLSTSGNNEDEGAGGYMGQLADARAAAASAGTEAEQAKIKMGLIEREIKDKEPRARKAAKEGEALTSELESKKQELDKLKGSLDSAGWDEGKETELLRNKAEHSAKIAELLESQDAIKSKLAAIDFTYSDPYPNFDRTKVKGLVASLIDLDEANYNSSTALEICAGGKLYNVVVEDEKVGSALLDKGRLRKRVTIIPLNKINAFRMSAEKLTAAKKLAPGKVNLALNLVGYDQDVSAAMAYVFGDMLICNDKESAQQVTFNKAVGVKSVTLDGDVYDPSGTLSGGAAPSGSGIIIKVQELKVIEKKIAEHKTALSSIEAELKRAKTVIDAFKKNKREVDLKQHEVNLLQEQVEGSNAAKIVADVDRAKKTLADLKETVVSAKERQKAATVECKRLEKEMADFKNNKDSKLTELRATIVTKKKALAKRTTELKTRQKESQTAELELEQMEVDCQAAADEIKEIEAAVAKAQKEQATLEKSLANQKKDHAAAEAKLKAEQAVLNAFDEELEDLDRDLKAKKQEIVDAELTLKKLEHDVGSIVKEKSTSEGIKQSLEQQFTWIVDESKFFGKPNTQYDFDGVNLNQVREKTRELEAQQKGMGRKINTKVMNMIDSVEKKEQSLTKMMSTVMGDKGKIEQTIAELDRYKRDALLKTWEKVNGDFGNIFAELLPGNFAKLQPPEGQDLTEGLEVKVRLGSVWKASLTELSGGQRSLIALSLIMSLLQFKPAPMYILDEIDAALDLQHTQHIGQLFRNRFKGSQFIVVSLKEGLFTNANVLFRARFRDGTSIVERTAHRSVQSEDKENDAPTATRNRGAPSARNRTAIAVR